MEAIIRFRTECAENDRLHRFTIQYYIYKDNGLYMAYCPALDITSYGKDMNDVVTNFYEHFQLYVEGCIEDNTLVDDLKAHGWKLDGVTISQPRFDELLMKQEFKSLMESDTEYERRNAILKFQLDEA